jgi:hypothetical protein
MKNTEFARRALEIAENYRTVYAKGMVGMPVNETYVSYMQGLYPDWYTEKKVAALLADAGRFGFDCVCLIKAILWGWRGDYGSRFGGALYKADGIPDFSVDGMLELSEDVSRDFSQIEVGEVLWIPGHVAIYIGDGLAVECTPAWDNGVQVTAVDNIGTRYNRYSRRWEKHGKLKYIDYEEVMDMESKEQEKSVGLPKLERGEVGDFVTTLQTVLTARGYFKADGSFGPITEAAVRAFQSDFGLPVTGKITENDWRILMGGEWA